MEQAMAAGQLFCYKDENNVLAGLQCGDGGRGWRLEQGG